MTSPQSLLRIVLTFDAATCFVMGGLCTLAATPLAGVMDLSPDLLRGAGLALIACSVFIGLVASRQQPSRTLVWTVIGGNLIWAAESVIGVYAGWMTPNSLGLAFVLVQAGAVILLAELEWMALRRMTRLA